MRMAGNLSLTGEIAGNISTSDNETKLDPSPEISTGM
jgi:hypothetical protein